MSQKKWAIGVDLGGTKIKCSHVDEDGNIQNERKVETDVSGGPEAIEQQIEEMSQQLISDASTKPESLGVGVAGQVVDDKGLVRYAPNLNWHDVRFGKALENPLNISVTVLNDVRAATWGEWLHGAGKELDNIICMFVGTGIGGSIVSEGKMIKGHTNSAGEIGHTTVALSGPKCHCGNLGCLEALAGSWAIEREGKKRVKESEKKSQILSKAGSSANDIKARHVVEAYNEHDELATQIMNDVINALAGGLTGLVNALNPQRIIMGGGVVEHTPGIIKKVEKKVQASALEAALESLEIVPTELDDNSGVIGAAAMTFQK